MIPVNASEFIVPPRPEFVPDRLGVRVVTIIIDRDTGRTSASLIPCPATQAQWGPQDAPEVSSPDLITELLSLPDSPEKLAALQAVQRISDDLRTVASVLIAGRQ